MDVSQNNSDPPPSRNQDNTILKELLNELTQKVSDESSRSIKKKFVPNKRVVEIKNRCVLEDFTAVAAEVEVVSEVESILPEENEFMLLAWRNSLIGSESENSSDELEINQIAEWINKDINRPSGSDSKIIVYRCRFCQKQLVLKDKKYLLEVEKRNTIRRKIQQHQDDNHPYVRNLWQKQKHAVSKVKCLFCSKLVCVSSLPFHSESQHKTRKKLFCSKVFGTSIENGTHFKSQNSICARRRKRRNSTRKESVIIPASKRKAFKKKIQHKKRFTHHKVVRPGGLIPIRESNRTSTLQTVDAETTNSKTLKRLKQCPICNTQLPSKLPFVEQYITHNNFEINEDAKHEQIKKLEGVSNNVMNGQTFKEVKIVS